MIPGDAKKLIAWAAGERNEDGIDPTDFRVREGDKVDLSNWPTNVDPVYKSKKDYKKLLRKHVAQLNLLQQLLYASNSSAVLIILQGMDAAGKDSAIKHVMSGVNPKAARYSALTTPARPNCSTTSSGALLAIYRSGDGSASSIDRTTMRC
jgi:polyphosphate kinase 2 (PPK2 family)